MSLNSSSNSSKSANDLLRGPVENPYSMYNSYHQMMNSQEMLRQPPELLSKRYFNSNASQNYAQIQKRTKFPDSGRRSAPLFGAESSVVSLQNNNDVLSKNGTFMVSF